MTKKILTLSFILALAVTASAQTAADSIRLGDEAYAAFNDRLALGHYQEALKLEPASYQAMWKTSRAYVDIADLIAGKDKASEAERMKMYTEAVALARKAVAADPNDTWGHFQLAAANGKRLLRLGKKDQIDASKEVRDEIEKALAVDPKNDLAWHAYGRWHHRMAEIGGAKRFFGSIVYGSIPKGSLEESEKYLRKALELKPGYVNHYLELGRTLAAMKKSTEALQVLQKGLELPKSSSKDDMLKEEIRTEIEKLSKKK